MGHSLHRIWIHGIFSTKYRLPMIEDSFESVLYNLIQNKLENELDCRIKIINGTSDHTHLLFLLSPNYSVKDIFRLIKGSSSHYINENGFTRDRFMWQTGYGAFSVCESKVAQVEAYILNQKEHHKKIIFREEFELLLKNHGIVGVNP